MKRISGLAHLFTRRACWRAAENCKICSINFPAKKWCHSCFSSFYPSRAERGASHFFLCGSLEPQNVRDFFLTRGFTPAEVFLFSLLLFSKCHTNATEDTICLALGRRARAGDRAQNRYRHCTARKLREAAARGMRQSSEGICP